MSRFTNTRQRVREIAASMQLQGLEPTPTTVLARLGKGSPNTVVDELRKWRAEQVVARTSEPEASVLAAAPVLAPQPLPPLPDALASGLSQVLEAQLTAMGRLSEMVDEMTKAVNRLDAMRTWSLTQLDEAREQTRYWTEEARRVRSVGHEKEDGYRRGMNAAQAEADTLRGQVEELRRLLSQAGVLRVGAAVSATASTFATAGSTPPSNAPGEFSSPRHVARVPDPARAGVRHYDADGRAEE